MFPRRVGTLANSITPNNANFITNPGSETTMRIFCCLHR
jgi:hypothetical protein